MTSPQQYTDTFKQTQDAMISAFDAWTRPFSGPRPAAGRRAVDPSQVINQVFDFATMLLNAQRDFAKQLVATASAATEGLKNDK